MNAVGTENISEANKPNNLASKKLSSDLFFIQLPINLALITLELTGRA